MLAPVRLAALLCGAAGGVSLGAGAGGEAQAAQASSTANAGGEACSRLAGARLTGVEIVSATSQAANAPIAGVRLPNVTGGLEEGPPLAGLPAFCRVVGRIRPEAGSEIGFEVWLPSGGWDGRLHGVGVGGFAGFIDYIPLSLALKGGQAAVATDTGHRSTALESAWAKGHPERVRDYGWRAVHLSTVAAKQLVKAFYGRGPDRSYFVGCSGGGRQGLMEAARFPDDYDGILAGAPAASFTELVMAMTNAIQAQRPPGAAIRPEQARLIQDEVVKQCDAGDGQVDGLVDDPRQCRFDAAKLACGASSSPQCLAPPQVAALRRIHAGPRNSSGLQLAGGYLPSGSEAGFPMPALGWDGYLLAKPDAPPAAEFLAGGSLQNLIQKPFATTATFDFDRDPARLRAAAAADIDASPNLSRFFARGGKLILWHGWADAAIPPEATLRYHQAMLRQSGARAKESSRLFMVPGVQHCIGGAGAMSFGQSNAPQPGDTPERSLVAALQAWVEGKRAAPDTVVGRRGFGGILGIPAPKPERQRLLCAWPKKAVLKPGGDPDQAAGYTCN